MTLPDQLKEAQEEIVKLRACIAIADDIRASLTLVQYGFVSGDLRRKYDEARTAIERADRARARALGETK